MKVLVVDDIGTNRHALSNLLRANGHEVVLAKDDAEMREKGLSEHFDVIVSEASERRLCGLSMQGELAWSERLLRHQAAMEHLLVSLSTRLVNASFAQLDAVIEEALEELASFAGADRSSLYRISRDKKRAVCTHAWHGPNAELVPELRTVDFERTRWLAGRLARGEIIYVPERAAVPDEATTERAIMEQLRAASFLCIPMMYADALLGYIFIASAHGGSAMDDADMLLIRAIADVFASTLARRSADRALERTNRALRMINRCDVAIAHATEEEALLREICRAIVEVGGHRAACARVAGEELAAPMLVASHGDCQDEAGPPAASRSLVLPLRAETHELGTLRIDRAGTEPFHPEEIELLEQLASDVSFGLGALRMRVERDRVVRERGVSAVKLRRSLEDSIQAIAATVEMRDPYTAGHQRRVALLSSAIAKKLGLAEDRIHGLRLAATIHDLGKVQVPSDILNRPGRLSAVEFALIKRHPQTGRDIMKDVQLPWPIADMIWQHHEHIDGSGYPQGLRGSKILLESRILTVADVAEAMASHRPYRAALGVAAAIKELKGHRGTRYDPESVDACVEILAESGLPRDGSQRGRDEVDELERALVLPAPLTLAAGE